MLSSKVVRVSVLSSFLVGVTITGFACTVGSGTGSLVGEALVDAGKWLSEGSTGLAEAQTPPVSQCNSWEIKTVTPPTTRDVLVPEKIGTGITAWVFDAFPLETGWEPFAGDFSRGPTIALRRCKAQ
jgi:hypothetical protein